MAEKEVLNIKSLTKKIFDIKPEGHLELCLRWIQNKTTKKTGEVERTILLQQDKKTKKEIKNYFGKKDSEDYSINDRAFWHLQLDQMLDKLEDEIYERNVKHLKDYVGKVVTFRLLPYNHRYTGYVYMVENNPHRPTPYPAIIFYYKRPDLPNNPRGMALAEEVDMRTIEELPEEEQIIWKLEYNM